jgi:hypothetical protein
MESEGWERARGLYFRDANSLSLLARAPVEAVAGVLAEGAGLWEHDVVGREIVVQADSVFVFRLAGHEWSIVVERTFARIPYGRNDYAWEKSASCRLEAPLILYGMSDTCGTIGYTLVERGDVVEDFFAEDDGSRPSQKGSRFASTRRRVRLQEIENIYSFVHDFLVEQDAYEPGIDFESFFAEGVPEVGSRATVQNPGHWENDHRGCRRVIRQLERVDYLVLRPTS